MNSNRSVLETLKYCYAKDVLTSISQVCEQWHHLSNLPELWESFCDHRYSGQNFAAKERYRSACASTGSYLLVFYQVYLILFNCELETPVSRMAVEMESATAAVMIRKHQALLCGGNKRYQVAFAVDFNAQSRQNLPDLIHPRNYHGIAKVKNFIYVFGGARSETTAEKFSILSQQWRSLPVMPQARSGFTPCVIGDFVYLCGGNTFLCHSFDTLSETYAALPIDIGTSSWLVATYHKGELLLESRKLRLRWDGAAFKEQKVDRYIAPWANINTVVVEDVIYLSMFTLGELFKCPIESSKVFRVLIDLKQAPSE